MTELYGFEVGNQRLDVTQVRLVDGFYDYDGLLEINVNGLWGKMCGERISDDTFFDLVCNDIAK